VFIRFVGVPCRIKPPSFLPSFATATMAAIFDASNPASPLAYSAAQTALLLLDFQGVVIEMCGEAGQAALAKAVLMREWARSNGIIVIHSVSTL
jgi:hypothetical protein